MTYRLNRRHFLSACGSTLALAPFARSVLAQPSSDYRALVIIFQTGGVDCHDTVLPYDSAAYNAFAEIRAPLLDLYGQSRERNALLPLETNGSSTGFALPPELSGLKTLFDEGSAAIIGNVGPLIEPTNLDDLLAGYPNLPPRLFSHNDQQSIWQANNPEGAQFGWGGLFADAVVASGLTATSPFTTVATGSETLLLTGMDTFPFSGNGSLNLELQGIVADSTGLSLNQLGALLTNQGQTAEHILMRDLSQMTIDAFANNRAYASATSNAPDLGVQFPGGRVGRQLENIARTIAVRDEFSINRQIFMAVAPTYDTHDFQAETLPALHTQLDTSILAFTEAMKNLGKFDDVVVATASDFGRTLSVNGDGTDHGWGGHHFVVGGAVNGGAIYGEIPDPVYNHSQDSGRGRLIPTISVDQYAAELGRWFGLTEGELDIALPNRLNFSNAPLENLLI